MGGGRAGKGDVDLHPSFGLKTLPATGTSFIIADLQIQWVDELDHDLFHSSMPPTTQKNVDHNSGVFGEFFGSTDFETYGDCGINVRYTYASIQVTVLRALLVEVQGKQHFGQRCILWKMQKYATNHFLGRGPKRSTSSFFRPKQFQGIPLEHLGEHWAEPT